VGQAPFLAADAADTFTDAGFDDVTLVPTDDPLADLQSGALDLAVLDAEEARNANATQPALRVVAGYRNYAGDDGAYGGDVLAATPGLVADEPATVAAFLHAYLGGLRQLDGPKKAAKALARVESAGVELDRDQEEAWGAAASAFAPFDGGFGSVRDEDGWGELREYLAPDDVEIADLTGLVAQPALNIGQASLGWKANPVAAGAPEVTEVTVGMPASTGDAGPIALAAQEGHFADVGLSSVEVVDIEEPLLGVLQGELDFAIVDAADAADGAAQGLPLVALAGHRNRADDGSYGGDVLAVSADFLEQQPATVAAFLSAYVRALQELGVAGDATGFGPFDGGFGDRSQAGGLGELDAYLAQELGSDIELDDLIVAAPLQAAQAWYGLPANPMSPLPGAAADASG
jgi:ABC-type nitrate/sulfonate/bicarbonate transport system substrate-binding protein